MDNEIELKEHRAMIYLPENAVEATMIVKVFHDGELIEVQRVLGISDLRTAFQKADEGYIDDDDRFEITDKGREWLESFQKQFPPKE